MSGARPDTWMPTYIGDYLADTMHLSTEEHGAYLLLIFAYWRRGGPLPDDDRHLSTITRAGLSRWHKALRLVLAPFFMIADGLWRHKRIDAELLRATNKTQERSKAGARGAAKRWQTDSSAMAEPQAIASQNDAPSQPQSQKESPAAIASPPQAAEVIDEPRPRKHRIAPDWCLTPEDIAYAFEEHGWPLERIEREGVEFKHWHEESGKKRIDFHRAWQSWVRKSVGFEQQRGQPRGNGSGAPSVAQAIAEGVSRAALSLAPR